MASLRDHGLRIGELEPGPAGSIADVEGVRVGHVTIRRDEPVPPDGRGVARTGVTAVVPGEGGGKLARPLRAGTAVLNGVGEMTRSLEIAEQGVIDTPIYLTATMAVGRVYDGAVSAAMAADPAVGVDHVVIPVVAECDDSWLSDARDVQLEAADAGRAVADASTDVAEGAVGGGAGMVCFDYKGGIGSSSRVAGGSVVGVLVMTNFGVRSQLRVDGVPVGRMLGEARESRSRPAGSCIVVVATDAPLSSAQLTRVARRAGLGLARTGSVAHDGSGEIFVAFSTAGETGDVPAPDLNAFFAATVDATEEAVLNSLWRAERVVGREGRVCEALPHERVLELLALAGRLER
ncbi:MAG TPA: P1 family peptidase [Thermoleophilaceae bacterium]